MVPGGHGRCASWAQPTRHRSHDAGAGGRCPRTGGKLATAQLRTDAGEDGRRLLARIAEYLDGPSALQLPLLTYERARVHALAGETDAALRTLDHAYELGLRTTWALDLRPQSFLYVDPLDADPAFIALRKDPRFVRWHDRLTADNARQLAHLRATDVPEATATHTD